MPGKFLSGIRINNIRQGGYVVVTYKNTKSKISAHIAVTLEPEQVIPCHDCPQGSPFCDTQFFSWGGKFMVV